MCFSQLELGANLGWITSQHPALKIDTRHGNPMTHHLNDINNAVSTYFVWLVWTVSSWWWWPGAPCPCKYSCHKVITMSRPMRGCCADYWPIRGPDLVSPCLLVPDSPMMGDRVARWAASIRLMRLVTWTPHHIREQRCSLLDVGCENTSACPVVQDCVDSYWLTQSNWISRKIIISRLDYIIIKLEKPDP